MVGRGRRLFIIGIWYRRLVESREKNEKDRDRPCRFRKILQHSFLRIARFFTEYRQSFYRFFWLSIAGAVIIPNGWDSAEALVFFAGMLGTLVVTDTLKAYGAREIRRFLTPQHTFWVQRSIGALLLIFGLVLLLRVF